MHYFRFMARKEHPSDGKITEINSTEGKKKLNKVT